MTTTKPDLFDRHPILFACVGAIVMLMCAVDVLTIIAAFWGSILGAIGFGTYAVFKSLAWLFFGM